MRKDEVYRKTKETEVKVAVNLDGEGKVSVCTRITSYNVCYTKLLRNSSFLAECCFLKIFFW